MPVMMCSSTATLARCRSLGVVVVGLDPAHQLAKPPTHTLDRVLFPCRAKSGELGSAGILIGDEPLCEGAVLDVGQHSLHVCLHPRIDHARPAHVVAVL